MVVLAARGNAPGFFNWECFNNLFGEGIGGAPHLLIRRQNEVV